MRWASDVTGKTEENSSKWLHRGLEQNTAKGSFVGFLCCFFFFCLYLNYREITLPIVFSSSANRMIAGGRQSAIGRKLLLFYLALALRAKQKQNKKKMQRKHLVKQRQSQ